MTTSTVSIEIPSHLFQRLKQKAEALHRPVEDFVIQTLAVESLPWADLPPTLAAELEAMQHFTDDALWAATKASFSRAQRFRLEQINSAAGERVLSDPERTEQTALLEEWKRAVARRARAFSILRLRGFGVPSLDELQAETDDRD
jgi:hypothetical protein